MKKHYELAQIMAPDWKYEPGQPQPAQTSARSNAGATPQAQQQALSFMEQAMAQARIQVVHVDWKD